MPVQQDRRRALAARLLENEQELIADFLGTIAREIPAYATLDERQLDEVRSIIGWTLRRVLDLWALDDTLTDEDVRLFRGVGAVRARDGRPLSAVLRAYRVAAVAFLDQMAERFSHVVSVDDVTSLIRVWFAALDELSEAIYDGYESTGRSLDEDRESSLRDLFVDLLLGRQSHSATLAARLRELDAELPTSFDLVVVRPGVLDGRDAGDRLIAEIGSAGTEPLVSSLHAVVDGVAVMMLAHVDPKRLDRALGREGLCATHQGGVTASTAPRAYRLAVYAACRAPTTSWAGRSVLDGGDLEVIAQVTGHGDADPGRLVRAVLGSLDREPELIATLDAVIHAGGAAQAADAMHVHPQTVRYRMRRVAALTGRDIRSPWHRFVLQTALLASAGTS